MKILLTGDSITAAHRAPGDPRDLGSGYVARLARALPEHDFRNTGVNGHKVPDLEARWERDVLAHEPDLVSIKIGINDTWHAFYGSPARRLVNRIRHTGGTTHSAFDAGYRELIARTLAAGIDRIVLVEPFLIPVDDSQLRMLGDLEEKMRLVAAIAEDHDLPLVRLHDAFTRAATERDPAELVLDGVHPEAAGDELIAELWLEVVAPLLEEWGAADG
ncbi:GDSL-type esterase/lipase family protein [Nocardioides sp. AE5]|uniref:SGNH/GDSL hydrolase family protein n=1 Tax=Nocardioides sp. AE5 TaxID=2962573 RepID=UPI0028816CA7|nr:GDSL-type esterase/lipase family protein [Nocardioides sp. AE5]MDT0203502.1 GDSL-type esterase/lipase family protein [Nocardioides sp. AE5]